jgi:exopolysaccharide production protein ExoZ
MTGQRTTDILGIDLARFMAATMVVIWHFAAKPWLAPQGATITPLMPPAPASIPPGAWFGSIGWIGVQVFFVISGAVIAFSATRARDRRAFLISRITRLWPAMLVCAGLCTVLSMAFWHVGAGRASVLLLKSLVFSPVGPWFSGQVWTLPVEVAFYALVCVVGVGTQARRLEGLAWGLALASGGYWLACTLWPGAMTGVSRHLPLVTLLPHGCYFALGIAIARGGVAGRFPVRLLALMTLTIATAWLEIPARAAIDLGASPYHPAPLVAPLVWSGTVLFILMSFLWRDVIATALARQSRVIRLMGMVTYPLYLVHYQVGGPVYALLVHRGWSTWGAFLPAYVLSVTVAGGIALLLEPPMQKALKAMLERELRWWPGREISTKLV